MIHGSVSWMILNNALHTSFWPFEEAMATCYQLQAQVVQNIAASSAAVMMNYTMVVQAENHAAQTPCFVMSAMWSS